MKERLVQIVIGLVLLVFGAWLVSATEWADEETRRPARGEAATNPLYAVQALLRELGATVVRRDSLDAMPPPEARMVLDSEHWDLFPDRAERLQQWVEQGGHLIIPGRLVNHASLEDWLPVVRKNRIRPEPKEASESDEPPKKSATASSPSPKVADCRSLVEADGVPPAYARTRSFRACGQSIIAQVVPVEGQGAPLWSVAGPQGVEITRMPFGQGTVTVLGPWSLLHNVSLLREDNPLLAVAALQVNAGAQVWFVVDEAREPFLPWIWRHGWVAIVLGLLALAAALWRAAVRFGPLIVPAGTARRSMAEQIRGTAEFLHQHGDGALHGAQVRALDEVASRRLRRLPVAASERTAAIAQASGLDPRVLERAWQVRPRSPAALVDDLGVLETARRRLDALEPFS